jgi:hypothetical protein
LRRNETDKASAGAAVNGSVESKAELLCGCKRLRRRGIAAMITQLVCGGIAALVCVGTAAAGTFVSAGTLIGLMLTAALVSVIISLF